MAKNWVALRKLFSRKPDGAHEKGVYRQSGKQPHHDRGLSVFPRAGKEKDELRGKVVLQE